MYSMCIVQWPSSLLICSTWTSSRTPVTWQRPRTQMVTHWQHLWLSTFSHATQHTPVSKPQLLIALHCFTIIPARVSSITSQTTSHQCMRSILTSRKHLKIWAQIWPQTVSRRLVQVSFRCNNISVVPWLPWHLFPPWAQIPLFVGKGRHAPCKRETGNYNSTCFRACWCLAQPAYIRLTTLEVRFQSQILEVFLRWAWSYCRRKRDLTQVTNFPNHLLTLCVFTFWTSYSGWVSTNWTLPPQSQWSTGKKSWYSST